MPTRAVLGFIALVALCAPTCRAPEPADAPRISPIARVYEAARDSVLIVNVVRTEVRPATDGSKKNVHVTHTQWGSGSVIHPAGYVLTNGHVLRAKGKREVRFANGKALPFEVVAVDHASDLALLKVVAEKPLTPLPLGSSSDLLVGDPAIVIGNPFGMGHTLAVGIVSALHRNTKTEYTLLTDMIQTDAGVNPGNSGGPLLNARGELVGVITSSKREADNINFATPIDKVRARFHHMVAPEGRYGFTLGMTVSPDGPPRVTAVVKGSPADAAGIRVDDVVTAVGLEPVSEGIHFTLALVGRKGGDALPLQLHRDGKPAHATVTLGPVVPLAAVDAPGALPGLAYHVYRGRWERLPDFARLKTDSHGTLPAFGLGPAKGQENIGLRIEGYVAVPADGNYAFYLSSDDGSRLWIGDRLVVDNDGLHAAGDKRGFVALKAGKHPIRVDFFECSGDEALAVAYEGPGIDKQPVPPAALFRPAATDH